MKATRKLIPAIALLLVSAVLLSTASYAWFTTNKVVNADMTVGVTAPQNLQISLDGSTNWKNAVDFPAPSTGNGYVLTPVSSQDGKAFVLATNLVLDQDGVFNQSKVDEIVAAQEGADPIGEIKQINSSTSETPKETYYIKNAFYLRATQAVAAGKLTLELTIDDSEGPNGGDGAEAYASALRVVVFMDADGDGTLETTVYKSEGEHDAIVHNGTKFVVGEVVDEYNTAYEADTTTGMAAVNLAAATTYKFEVVVWLEGNDPACVSANVDSAPNLDINLKFTVTE